MLALTAGLAHNTELRAVRHPAVEQILEDIPIDVASQTKTLRAFTKPLPLGIRIVSAGRVVVVLLVVGDSDLGRGNGRHAQHRAPPDFLMRKSQPIDE